MGASMRLRLRQLLISFLLLPLILATVVFVSPQKANAVTGADWKPGRIIDDSIFFNKNAMSVGQIQAFLNAKVPVCAKNHSAYSSTYPPPYTCLKDYQENTTTGESNVGRYNSDGSPFQVPGGKSAAQIIWDAAQTYTINPQTLLVMLQKEQSLITDDWPLITQYQKAMGQSCPDTAPCDPAFAGFYRQVSGAAWQLRHYINNPTWFNYRMGVTRYVLYNPNSSCGGTNVFIENNATAALYNYTPYQPNPGALNNLYGTAPCGAYGNRNFWRLFNDWFGTTISGVYPSPVYHGDTNTGLFVVWGTTKYHIPSNDVLIAWGLHKYTVNIAPDSFMNQLTNGGALTNIAKMSDDPSSPLFMFDDGKRYEIPITACLKNIDGSLRSSTSWGLDCFNTSVSKSYPSALVQNYTTQDIVLPEMIAFDDSVWKLEAGKKRRIIDPLVIDVLGGWTKVRWMKDLNASQPVGKLLTKNGDVLKFSDSDVIYIYDNGQLNIVPSPGVFVAWGLDKRVIKSIQSSFNSTDPLPTSPTQVSQVAKNTSNGKYYLVDKGYKMELGTDLTTQWPTSSFVVLPESLNLLSQIPLSDIYLAENGPIFTVIQGYKYLYPTMDDFFQLGANASRIRIVSNQVQNLSGLQYGGMHLANGRLFKVSSNPHQIYRVNGSTSQYVNSTNYPGLPYSKLINVDDITLQRYPVNGVYLP